MTCRIRSFLLPLLLLVSLASCADQRMRNAFSESEEIHLMVGGDIPLSYDPNTCQLAFSRDLREFRVHTDNMSDFYVLTLSAVPVSVGQRVSGSLTWTTHDEVLTRKNITLETVRLEGDKIWLWSNSARIGLVVSTLE